MAKTPFNELENTTVIVELKLDGKDMPDSYGIQSIKVHHAINRISTAELVLTGEIEAETDNIPVTDSNDFNPGKNVEILAGYAGTELSTIFKGIIVKHTVKLNPDANYSFIIECRHEAVRMTYNETERFFQNQTDDAVIRNIINEYGISCNVNSRVEVNECMFQKMSTDWDFIVSRCNFIGSIVMLDDNPGIVIKPPTFSAPAVLSIEAGISMISFIGSLDAGFQPAGVNAAAWNTETVSLMSVAAVEATINRQGNISAKDLSTAVLQADLNVISATPMTNESLQTWADGILLRKRLSAFKGTVEFFGSALAKTGSIIEIKGVGKKLSGEAFVSEVTNIIDSGNWTTAIVFGLNNDLIFENPGNSYPPAMGQVPGIQGLQLAIVKKIDQDPDNLSRILVEIASRSTTPNTTWARMAHYYASNKSGSFFLPEIDDEVILGFLDNDPRYPVILGSLYNEKNTAAYTATTENDIKAFVTRSNIKMEFDDRKKSISLSTPGNSSIIISDDGKLVEIKDQQGNSITLNTDGIRIDSAKDIDINANGNITLNAKGKVNVTAKQELALSGLNVQTNADVALTAKAGATAELSSSGQTTIKGAIVMIN